MGGGCVGDTKYCILQSPGNDQDGDIVRADSETGPARGPPVRRGLVASLSSTPDLQVANHLRAGHAGQGVQGPSADFPLVDPLLPHLFVGQGGQEDEQQRNAP